MTRILFDRIDEDFALIEEMLALVPPDNEDWRPDWAQAFTMAELAAHLTESCGGVCACFARLHPALGWTRAETSGLNLDGSRSVLASYRTQIRSASALTIDADWVQVIPTFFVPAGEPFLAVVLKNLKHVNHHAHQLFIYLKLLGVPVSTRDLYRFQSTA